MFKARFRNYKVHLAKSEPIVCTKDTTEFIENHDGTMLEVSVPTEYVLNSPEVAKSIPSYKEYTLQALIQAGVKLDVINTSGLLNPTDVANLGKIGTRISTDIYNKLVELSKEK